jgi:hypothetical protein
MADQHQIADEIRRLQLVADNPTTQGNTLQDIHTSLCLINARRTIATNGKQDRALTFFTDHVGHASFMRTVLDRLVEEVVLNPKASRTHSKKQVEEDLEFLQKKVAQIVKTAVYCCLTKATIY